ncbi:MAG TPA: tyrosine-protein phosphatase [Thermoleophilaceae bacterium]
MRLVSRQLNWDGGFNLRDLGGLPTRHGHLTRHGAVVRAGALDGLTQAGWAALTAHGVKTVIDLRNDDEPGVDAAARPQHLTTIRLPLDGIHDREFWDVWASGPQFATPLYFRPHLERFPERNVAVLSAIARADPGGVVVHCRGGRDRTGQITMLLLALVGVAAEDIAADYALSSEGLPAPNAAHDEPDKDAIGEAFLAAQGTTAEEVIVDSLRDLDLEAWVRTAGLSESDVGALRTRLLGTRRVRSSTGSVPTSRGP